MGYDGEEQRIWIGKPNGLSGFDIKSQQWLDLSNDNGNGFSGRNVRSISVGENCLWLGTSSGLAEYNKSDNTWEEYRALMTREPLREFSASNITFDGDYVWFSNWSDSRNGAIVRFDRQTDTWQYFGRETILEDTESKSMTQVRDIIVDDDAVWFATDYGILRYDKADDTWEHFTTEDGLADNNINYIACGDSVVWVSYWSTTQLTGAEVSKYDKESRKWETLPIQYLTTEREFVRCIAADGDEVWLSVSSSGVRRISKDGTQKRYTKEDGLDQNFLSTGVLLYAPTGDEIWFANRRWGGGRDTSAVTRYRKTTGEWEVYSSCTGVLLYAPTMIWSIELSLRIDMCG